MADLDNIKIIKEKRKSLAVEVYPNFSVVIKSPEQAKDFEIKDFIKRKSPQTLGNTRKNPVTIAATGFLDLAQKEGFEHSLDAP
jgi:hypothetical protein